MDDIAVYSIGVVITLLASIGVVVYLKPHVGKILIDLCGTPERANFWLAFSNVALILTPLICTLAFHPDTSKYRSIFFVLSDQLMLGLLGLIATVVVVGFTISRFIPPIRWVAPSASIARSEPKIQ